MYGCSLCAHAQFPVCSYTFPTLVGWLVVIYICYYLGWLPVTHTVWLVILFVALVVIPDVGYLVYLPCCAVVPLVDLVILLHCPLTLVCNVVTPHVTFVVVWFVCCPLHMD